MKPLSRLWIFCLFVFLLPACLEEGENPSDGDADVPDSDLEVADGDGESLPTCGEDWSHPVLAACIAPIEGWTDGADMYAREFDEPTTEPLDGPIDTFTRTLHSAAIVDSGDGFPAEHAPCMLWYSSSLPFNLGAGTIKSDTMDPSALNAIDDRLKHWLILEDARGQQWFLGFVGIPFLPDLDPEKGVTVEWLSECELDCHFGSMSLLQNDNVLLAFNTALHKSFLKLPEGFSVNQGPAYCSFTSDAWDTEFTFCDIELTANESCRVFRKAEARYMADSGWLMLGANWMGDRFLNDDPRVGDFSNPKRFALIRRAADPTGTEIPGYAWTERMCAE